jgi:hypothetical protein
MMPGKLKAQATKGEEKRNGRRESQSRRHPEKGTCAGGKLKLQAKT